MLPYRIGNGFPDALRLAVHVVQDGEALASQAAERLSALCEEAVNRRGFFTLALSGGNTPVVLFRLLRRPEWRRRLAWERTRVFWADERCVGPDHEASNYGVASRELLVHVQAEFVRRMHGEREPEAEARAYARTLREAVPTGEAGIPRFDCILLGMGEDGHTASLFPDSPLLNVDDGKTVAAVFAKHLSPRPESRRLTLTLPVLNEARCCLFLVAGEAKREPLREALDLLAPPRLPVQFVRPARGELVWIVDEAACPRAV